MNATNLYRALAELLPEVPLLVATVVAVDVLIGISTVEYPGGGQQRVRGTTVPIGGKAFVRADIIEGAAPVLATLTIEV